jgi:hypothetical protein
VTYLAAGEEVGNGLPPELSALDGLVVDLSALLLTDGSILSSGSLGEVLIVRLGDLLLFLLNRGGGSYGSLALGSTPTTISSFSSGSLRSVLLVLGILLALLFGCRSA